MSVTCEICGKEFKNTQGLRGHKTFVHQRTSTQDPPARPATEQEVSIIEDRLSKLEYITGLKGSYSGLSPGDLLGDTKPLTNKLNDITEQLAKLSGTVSKLNEQVELAQTGKLAEQDRALGELREQFELELNGLSAVVNKYRDGFNHDLADAGLIIAKIQKAVQDLGFDNQELIMEAAFEQAAKEKPIEVEKKELTRKELILN